MARVVKLTESQLKDLINEIILKEDIKQSYNQGVQTGTQAGQKVRQAVNTAAVKAVNIGKQIVVTIGKITFNIFIAGATVVYLIGKGLYKVSAAVSNAILKFLASTGKAVVSGAQAVGKSGMDALKAAGIAIEKGSQAILQGLNSAKEATFGVVKWVIQAFKQFGVQAWAKILVGAAAIKEFGGAVSGWLGQQWGTIQNQVGVAWDKAASWASGAYNKAKQTVSSAYNTVKQGVTGFANKAANVAGNVWGGIKGFLQEMFERYHSFTGKNTLSILSEAIAFNGKSIL
jgi:hypothetical protein